MSARPITLGLPDEALEQLAGLLAPLVAERLTALAPTENGYLAAAAAAEYLGVSRKRIYDLRSAGALPPDGHDGRTPLWRRSTLDAYVRGERP